MSKKGYGLLMALAGLVSVSANAQIKCGTDAYIKQLEQQDPAFASRRAQIEDDITKAAEASRFVKQPKQVITIPVVFHVVYRTDQENISDEQIMSQLQTLNQDFRKQNSDTINIPAGFAGRAADTEFQFCLAHTDPDGYYTSGITRTRTSVVTFTQNDDFVKFSDKGGRGAWDPQNYLNIWVCNLENLIIGYSSVPGSSQLTDGVVIDFEATGSIGTAKAPYNRGRTLTHEMGHWFGLRHIWGADNQQCGSDLVHDTPEQMEANFGCKTYPHRPNSCDKINPHGDMFMNFMDYSNDACMHMFTLGQKTRMAATFNTWHSALKNSMACADGNVNPQPPQEELISIYPIPATKRLTFSFAENKTAGPYRIVIYDQVGRKISEQFAEALLDNKLYTNISHFSAGIYTAAIEANGLTERRQFVVIH